MSPFDDISDYRRYRSDQGDGEFTATRNNSVMVARTPSLESSAKRASEFPMSRYSIYVARNWSYFYILTSGRECVLFAHTDRPDPPSFVRRNKQILFKSRGTLFAPRTRELALTKIAFKSRLIRREVTPLHTTASSSPTRSMFYHLRGPPCGSVNWKNRTNGKTGCSFRAWNERSDPLPHEIIFVI